MIGTILGLAKGLVDIANKVMDAFRDKKLRDEGANEQKLSDTQEVLKNVEKANAAADDPDIAKRVRDKYER